MFTKGRKLTSTIGKSPFCTPCRIWNLSQLKINLQVLTDKLEAAHFKINNFYSFTENIWKFSSLLKGIR